MLLSLPLDVLRLIICTYLTYRHAIPLYFTCKTLLGEKKFCASVPSFWRVMLQDAFLRACELQHVALMSWYAERFAVPDNVILRHFFEVGSRRDEPPWFCNLEMYKWYTSEPRKGIPTYAHVARAVYGSRLDILRWIHGIAVKRPRMWQKKGAGAVAEFIASLQFHAASYDKPEALALADTLVNLRYPRQRIYTKLVGLAIRNGSLRVLKWLHEHGGGISSEDVQYAERHASDSVDERLLYEWIKDKCPCDPGAVATRTRGRAPLKKLARFHKAK